MIEETIIHVIKDLLVIIGRTNPVLGAVKRKDERIEELEGEMASKIEINARRRGEAFWIISYWILFLKK